MSEEVSKKGKRLGEINKSSRKNKTDYNGKFTTVLFVGLSGLAGLGVIAYIILRKPKAEPVRAHLMVEEEEKAEPIKCNKRFIDFK